MYVPGWVLFSLILFRWRICCWKAIPVWVCVCIFGTIRSTVGSGTCCRMFYLFPGRRSVCRCSKQLPFHDAISESRWITTATIKEERSVENRACWWIYYNETTTFFKSFSASWIGNICAIMFQKRYINKLTISPDTHSQDSNKINRAKVTDPIPSAGRKKGYC